MAKCAKCGSIIGDKAKFCGYCGTKVEPETPQRNTGWQESVKQESVRQESAKQESAKQESVKQESVKQESVKQESVKQESVKQESVKQESVEQESVEQESAKQESVKQESVKQESVKQERAKQDRTEQDGARRTQYDGAVHKCPYCGEELSSFTLTCPSCGRELRDTRAASLMSDFERRYNLADTAEDKIDLIRSLAIPNTREDILELFLLASSNVDADSYVKAANDRGDKKEGAERLELTEAWIAKMEQTYQKAKILLAGDASMEKIERIYQKTVVKVSKGKRKGWIAGHKEGFLLLLCVIALFSLCIRVNCYSRESKEKEEALVAEIRQDIDEGNYDVALTKAAQLDKELRDVFISQISEKQGKAKIPDEDLDGRVYTDAVLQFQKAGFTNITTEVMPQDDGLYEFFFGRKDNEGEVAEITIDGSTSFTRGSYISKDAVIIIRYYSYKDGETGGTVSSAGTELATTPEEQLVGTPCSTVVQKFSDAGFTNISTKVVTNTNSAKSGLVIEISVDGKTDYTLDTAFPQNVEIVIRYFQYC